MSESKPYLENEERVSCNKGYNIPNSEHLKLLKIICKLITLFKSSLLESGRTGRRSRVIFLSPGFSSPFQPT